MAHQCDGYVIFRETFSPRYSVDTSSASSASSNTYSLSSLNPSFHPLGQYDEARYFDHFRARTGPQMAGFFPNEFWSTLILRAIFHEPVIKHAVLALSSLHECFSNGDRSILNPLWDKGGGGYALTQYNKAIEHLVKPAQKRPQAVDVCLVACMLFSSFEVSPDSTLYPADALISYPFWCILD